MKCTTKKTEETKFAPVTVELTFETQQELDRWASLLNSGRLSIFLSGSELRQVLTDAGGDQSRHNFNTLFNLMYNTKYWSDGGPIV